MNPSLNENVRVGAASDAPAARRAHNGVGGRRMAVARMCITGLSYIAARLCAAQELKTLMHIGATIDSVGFGQCPAPSWALSSSHARESVSKQCPAPSQALSLSRGRRWQQTLSASHVCRMTHVSCRMPVTVCVSVVCVCVCVFHVACLSLHAHVRRSSGRFTCACRL